MSVQKKSLISQRSAVKAPFWPTPTQNVPGSSIGASGSSHCVTSDSSAPPSRPTVKAAVQPTVKAAVRATVKAARTPDSHVRSSPAVKAAVRAKGKVVRIFLGRYSFVHHKGAQKVAAPLHLSPRRLESCRGSPHTSAHQVAAKAPGKSRPYCDDRPGFWRFRSCLLSNRPGSAARRYPDRILAARMPSSWAFSINPGSIEEDAGASEDQGSRPGREL